MKRFAFVLIICAALTANCAFMKNIRIMNPEMEYNPFRVDNLNSDEPLIIQGPFLDNAINETVYIVTDGYIKLHKKLWKKIYPQSRDAEGITRSRLLIQYEDYKAKFKGDDVTFRSAWKVRAELVEFVESVRKK